MKIKFYIWRKWILIDKNTILIHTLSNVFAGIIKVQVLDFPVHEIVVLAGFPTQSLLFLKKNAIPLFLY